MKRFRTFSLVLLGLITGPVMAQNEARLLYPPPARIIQVSVQMTPPPPASATSNTEAADSATVTGVQRLPAEAPMTPGSTLIVRQWQPPMPEDGPPPAFETLDTNGDGRISWQEAQAYPLLANDFEYAAGHAHSISKARYRWWAAQAH